MALSSDPSPSVGRLLPGRLVDGVPFYGYLRTAGLPPVAVARLEERHRPPGGWPPQEAHAHDFLALCSSTGAAASCASTADRGR